MTQIEDEEPWSDLAWSARGRLLDLSGPGHFYDPGPPLTKWVQVADLPAVKHRRCCAMTPSRSIFELRAVTEIYEDSGSSWITLVEEPDWYRWYFLPPEERPERPGRGVAFRARFVWVEVALPHKMPDPNTTEGDLVRDGFSSALREQEPAVNPPAEA